ncbi:MULTISPECIES: T9SS type A sorting domain-containing protein [Flavobacterium]|nr:T9SS type A sorting domain-containing protein [Flavobacterium sp. N1846]
MKNNLTVNDANENSKNESELVEENTKATNIHGLKVMTRHSQKFGNQVYVISDSYSEKNVSFYDDEGKKVYSKKTVGTPINLSKLKRGIYTMEIVEGDKTDIKEITIE